MKTNFSFEVQYLAVSATDSGQNATSATPEQREDVMQRLQALLQTLIEPLEATATVQVTDSHRGANSKIVELVTTLDDDQIASALKRFCDLYGVSISALE